MKRLWTGACVILCLAIATAAAHAAQLDQTKLIEIDRTFVCPESLPTSEAKETSLKQFLSQVAALGPVTVAEMIDLRMRLLAKHGCTETLQRIHENAREKP